MDIRNISVTQADEDGEVSNTVLFNCVDVNADDNNVAVTVKYEDLSAANKTKWDETVAWISQLT